MTRPFVFLSTIAIVLCCLAYYTTAASAGWWEEKGNPPVSDDPDFAAIELISCDDGAVATWARQSLTYRIDYKKASKGQLAAVRSGVAAWKGSPYQLAETTGSSDIVIRLVEKLENDPVGAAVVNCASGKAGISGAELTIAIGELKEFGIQNVTAHEVGHALGLAHSDYAGDLMDGHYDKKANNTAICPSNLDIAALELQLSATSIPVADWSAPRAC